MTEPARSIDHVVRQDEAETVILPDGGHFFPVARARAFTTHLLAFLGAGAEL